MAPVTATSTGIARQTIDDPILVNLIRRLSDFDGGSVNNDDRLDHGGVVQDIMIGSGDDASAMEVDDNNNKTTEGSMMDVDNDVIDNEAGGRSSSEDNGRVPDVAGLVAALDSVPKWQFQEQADLYEWIRPLNAMDAVLNYLMDMYPSMLLLPRETKKKKPANIFNRNDTNHNNDDGKAVGGSTSSKNDDDNVVPEEVTRAILSILRFQSTLLRNATSKHVYNSVRELSDLLTAANDDVAASALSVLAGLAVPPMLHRQQAPEAGQHSTALHRSGGGSGGDHCDNEGEGVEGTSAQVMGRLMNLARGWGAKGTGLGLLSCVSMDDASMNNYDDILFAEMDRNNNNEETVGVAEEEKARRKNKQEEWSFIKRAGEIMFEYYYQPTPTSNVNKEVQSSTNANKTEKNGRLISLYVTKEEMFVASPDPPAPPLSSSSSLTTTKRRKILTSGVATNLPRPTPPPSQTIKSTARLYRECLVKIKEQLSPNDLPKDDSTLPPLPQERLFALLSSIRLARSFHTSSSRIAAVKHRLRALICVVHAYPDQEGICSYFVAQPELTGELVDLLRPTVSSGHISTTGAKRSKEKNDDDENGSILAALSDSPVVPYSIRSLAVEALTALVARRDMAQATNAATNIAKQTNVLIELGVGKGQYLGLLPTLIRYSLAALNSFFLNQERSRDTNIEGKENVVKNNVGTGTNSVMDIGIELGLAFLRATKPPPLPLKVREERALEFIDSILTLTSAVISVPSGTASLTDCGIIPALVSTIALDGQMARRLLPGDHVDGANESEEESYSVSLLKFISAQAIQILEGAIVTHNSALSAFHELKGVDILIQRLRIEVEKVKLCQMAEDSMLRIDGNGNREDTSAVMESSNDSTTVATPLSHRCRSLQAARRVLLFSAVNCLTVVFHQHDANSGTIPASSPNGGALLRRPELLCILIEIMDNVDSYGGVLAALVATFLSDVMNSDPQVVHFVHSSGLAKSFLSLLATKESNGQNEPLLAPSAELIMAIPNVIMALSLTEAGAKAVAEANPFPALLSIFCCPKYVMPNSRCLLNEMAAIIGTGLDEFMRHNPNLRSICLTALVEVMGKIVKIGQSLIVAEDEAIDPNIKENVNDPLPKMDDLISDRTCLMQFGFNIVQLLEQILHSDDHITSFVDVGGFDALLDLAQYVVTPSGRSIVAHVTCLSCPSITSISHNTSNTIAVLVKSVFSNTTDPSKLIKKVISRFESQFPFQDCTKILDDVPPVALYNLDDTLENKKVLYKLSQLFRSVIYTCWLTNCLASTIRAICQRGNDMGSSVSEREWKKEFESQSFAELINNISLLHRTSLFEVCRIRTETDFDSREAIRGNISDKPLIYKIRIVCQEGAIVRNGIEIDRCESVGNVEMGEIVYAYDRCINSSGVLRYQTSRGWVSELTRGHGRENIAEVLDVTVGTGIRVDARSKRIESRPADLRSSAAAVLSRLNSATTNLFSSFEKMIISGIRQPARPLSFQLSSAVAPHIISATKILSFNLRANLEYVSSSYNVEAEVDETDDNDGAISLSKDAATCMYLGTQLNALHSALKEEDGQASRRAFNVPLLINLLVGDGWRDGVYALTAESADVSTLESEPQMMSAIQFVLRHSLRDMAYFAAKHSGASSEDDKLPHLSQRMSRAVASSLPPTLSLLQKLFSRSLLLESQIAITLTKMKQSDFVQLITNISADAASTIKYNAAQFARALHMKLAKITYEFWSDKRFAHMPSHVIFPWLQYFTDVVRNLEEAGKVIDLTLAPNPTTDRITVSGRLRDFQDPFSGRLLASMGLVQEPGGAVRRREAIQEPFEPSEESILRLTEMGFGRDHAVEAFENVGSNRVDVAMEYALLHPPSSPATLERTRAARAQRRQEQQARIDAERLSSAAEGPSISDAVNNAEESRNMPLDTGTQPAVDEGDKELKSKPLTQDDMNVQVGKEMEEKLAAQALDYSKMMKESVCKVSLDIIEQSGKDRACDESGDITKMSNDGGSDQRSVIIVVSNFLLDFCKSSLVKATTEPPQPLDAPVPLESSIGLELLERIKLCLDDTRGQSEGDIKSFSNCHVKPGCSSFAALVHSSVIFFRSHPKLRPLVLRHGIVGIITHCVRNVTVSSALRNIGTDASVPLFWPDWLAPALLLLEVMASPTSVALDEEETPHKKSEYTKVLAEHKSLSKKQAQTVKSIFSAVSSNEVGKMTPKKKKDSKSIKKQSSAKNSDITGIEEGKQEVNIPTFLPLLHSDTQEACMILCLQLLGRKSKKGVIDRAHLEKVCPPSEIVNAVLVLLLRLLRSRHLSSKFVQMLGADLILSLPDRAYFQGNRDIVSLLLRRMLEDEVTLIQMMDTEIRSIVARVYRKQHPSQTGALPTNASVNLNSFIQACTPLVCRDPLVFVKALVSSLKIESKGSESSILSSSRGSQVTLLSADERARNAKRLNSLSAEHSVDVSFVDDNQTRRRSIAKNPKATPLKSKAKNHIDPTNHVISILLREITRDPPSGESSIDPFLSTIDHVDILADLVLASPSCGAAIHRYKPAIEFHHALSGSPAPPQTAVSFILHKLLPQPRLAVRDTDKKLRAQAYNNAKMAQSGARLVVCLVARSGELRRSVVEQIVFALSSGQLPRGVNAATRLPELCEAELWAISSWGDLVAGISSPRRSITNSTTNQESNATLSFPIVKLMLEQKVAHALMMAIERITLHHPMASSVASSIMRPLEIYTRGAVYSTVNEMHLREKDKAAKASKDPRRTTADTSEPSEPIYDIALDNEFHSNNENAEHSADNDDDESTDDESDASTEIEVRLGDDEDSESSSEEDDDESGEEDDEEDDDEDDESGGDDMDDDAESEHDSSESEDEEVDDEVEAEGEEVDDDNFFLDVNADNEAINGLDQETSGENEPLDETTMEGWTQINNGGRAGLGRMLLDLVQPHGIAGRQSDLANGGFLMDAAETMLGNILRGDIGGLAELEDSLGIRVVRGDRGDSRGGSLGLPPGFTNRLPENAIGGETRRGGVREGIGRPAVQQNSANTYIFGNRGQIDPGPMEVVFGTSAVGPIEHDVDDDRHSEVPSTYDTQLFPEGVAAAASNIRSGGGPIVHPLIQSLSLPPSTSINFVVASSLSQRERPTLQRNNGMISMSGPYIAGANGSMIQVSNRLQLLSGADQAYRSTNQSTSSFSIWADDGVHVDDFSATFGQALDSFLQDQANSQEQEAEGNDPLPGLEDSTTTQNGEVSEGAPSEHVEDAPMSEPEAAQELQSETAEVSSALATGLTISQHASDNSAPLSSTDQIGSHDQSNNDTNAAINNDDMVIERPAEESTSNDQVSNQNQSNNSADAAENDMVIEQPAEESASNDQESNQNQSDNDTDAAADDNMVVERQAGEDTNEILEAATDSLAEVPREEDANEVAAPPDVGADPLEIDQEEEMQNEDESGMTTTTANEAEGALTCPPDIDPEVFNSLPLEMQQEIVQQHEVDAQISESGLDPEALAALPEEMRREVIEQEQQQQRQRELEAESERADPANAEDMDNASFLASLAPDLRQEILLTADDTFINSLPPTLIAEANVLRERVVSQHRQRAEEASAVNALGLGAAGVRPGAARPAQFPSGAARERRQRNGRLRIESDRKEVVWAENVELSPFLTTQSTAAFLSLLYLLIPVQPQRVMHKVFLNLCLCHQSRQLLLNVLLQLLLSRDNKSVTAVLEKQNIGQKILDPSILSSFPPSGLIGSTADLDHMSMQANGSLRKKPNDSNSAATVAASLPASACGSSHNYHSVPPVVARRIISCLSSMCKSSPRVAFSMLLHAEDEFDDASCFEKLLDLLDLNQYKQSASNLEQLFGLLEIVAAPMSLLPKDDQEVDLSTNERVSPGKEWVKVPRLVINKKRLHSLINILSVESCRDSSFLKISTLLRRLSRVHANRECILDELALVAENLGKAAILDLKAVSVRLSVAANHHNAATNLGNGDDILPVQVSGTALDSNLTVASPSSAVSLSTSNSELKFLRVLQMLHSLCIHDDETKSEGNQPEFVSLLQAINLESLWDQLDSCLKTVSILEGVASLGLPDNDIDGEEEGIDGDTTKQLQNSVAGLITRFLPAIEAFFMVNASSTPENDEDMEPGDNSRVVQFAASNKILLNSLLRSNPQLLEKGLRAMVKMPQCRSFLDFDVKRSWFKTQLRRLRQQANRRHGSFRLNLRRKYVFEDSFHAFVHRNADELRGRLHVTFQDEEGVDAGGLSREFFAILAKEMFNPNYALFMSTEDGCTFQPNPNSSINPDDLRYFKFVGRIVGKAVVDGFLLDAHFTRSLYKHMLGLKPTHKDMEAIDPEYYKNLQLILEHNLEDIGLELTFSTEDHSFGRSQTIDLIPGGRAIPVTEDSKERYVDLVCQHRMTTAIEKQIKAYLEGFHEIVDKDLISIFNARELELLISGMPEIDIHDLKKNTDYNGYRPADREIGWFWNILFALTRSEKAAFLQFVTGSSKVPLAGFSELQGMRGVQKFSINKASGSTGALMSAHTCFNALDLPVYSSEEEMKKNYSMQLVRAVAALDLLRLNMFTKVIEIEEDST